MSAKLAVIGAGSWGTALALALSSRFPSVSLWARDPNRAAALEATRENARYLPGFSLSSRVRVSADLAACLRGASVVIVAVPSRHFRAVLTAAQPSLAPAALVVSATKGLEDPLLCRMSQVIAHVCPTHPAAVLSGPTFAQEIAAGEPAAVVIAAAQASIAEQAQHALSTSALRLYASTDVIGTEIGAALKNVVAIGAGLCTGLGLGGNSVAALVTRGLAEITRLAVALGGMERTLSGLAGLGDLVLTATGDLSRNRSLGLQLARGRSLLEAEAGMHMVAEGVVTCRAAYTLGFEHKVDLPIIGQMYRVLYESKPPWHAIRELMDRPLRTE